MTGATTRSLLFISMIFELLGVFLAIIYHQFYQHLEERQLIELSSALLHFAAWTPVVLILTGMIILTVAVVMELF
jgi:hypothetical protein